MNEALRVYRAECIYINTNIRRESHHVYRKRALVVEETLSFFSFCRNSPLLVFLSAGFFLVKRSRERKESSSGR